MFDHGDGMETIPLADNQYFSIGSDSGSPLPSTSASDPTPSAPPPSTSAPPSFTSAIMEDVKTSEKKPFYKKTTRFT